jgi:hypothetical protein
MLIPLTHAEKRAEMQKPKIRDNRLAVFDCRSIWIVKEAHEEEGNQA